MSLGRFLTPVSSCEGAALQDSPPGTDKRVLPHLHYTGHQPDSGRLYPGLALGDTESSCLPQSYPGSPIEARRCRAELRLLCSRWFPEDAATWCRPRGEPG